MKGLYQVTAQKGKRILSSEVYGDSEDKDSLFARLMNRHKIVHSRMGRALVAIRENKDMAESIGINIANYRLLAFVISAFICGVGGAMMAHYLRYCYPELASVFLSVNLMLYTIIGGPGTLLGPAVAAFLFTLFPEFCLLYTSPSPRDRQKSRMPSSA